MRFSLEEKRAYFIYPSSGWTYKTPPELSPDVAREMEREGLNENYRFIWCGVDVVRTSETDLAPEVRGDRRACRYRKVQMGYTQIGSMRVPRIVDWLEPKNLFVNTRQPHAFFYLDDDGHRVEISQPEFVPPGKLVQVDFLFHALGRLHWRQEQRISDEQQATMHIGDDGWVSIGTTKAKDGRYAEPTLAHVLDLVKRRSEDRNRSKKELVAIARKESAQREEDAKWDKLITEAEDKAEINRFIKNEVFPYVENRPHTVS